VSARSRAARRRRQSHIAWGAAALVAALGVLAAAGWFWFGSRADRLDPATLCPASGPKGHVVLLVDRTDPLNFTQKQAFLAYLAEFGRGRVGEGELLSVFVLGGDLPAHARPVFALCNPGRGEGKSLWTANPERLRRQFEQKFSKPVAELAERLQTATAAPVSPIMEMLQLVAVNGFRAAAVEGPRRLYVVSDLLQNTPAFSHYRAEPDFAGFRETPLFAKVRTDLTGVEVELAYLLHNPERQTRRHAKFWEDYFRELGARVVAVRVLEG
jgi:hypothetical protein